LLDALGLYIHKVVNLNADQGELLRRLTGRRTCANCGATYHIQNKPPRRPDTCDRCGGRIVQRSDDNEESVRQRLENFERVTRPLLEHYRSAGLVSNVNGDGQIWDVQRRVQKAIEE
jgi:adenylate kinase